MNLYYIYDSKYESTILFDAVAENEKQVEELAHEAGIDIEGLVIEKIWTDVVDELHRSRKAYIRDAQVH